MSTRHNILGKYKYVYRGLEPTRHSFLKGEKRIPSAGVIVVVCRGKSYELLEESTWPDVCQVLVVVNDWSPGPLPEIVMEYKQKSVNYLTNMGARRPRWKIKDIPVLRSAHALSINKQIIKELDDQSYNAFHLLWGTKDTGLRAIAISSLRCGTVVIAGLDFWEAPYWPGDSKDIKRKTSSKMKKGLKHKDVWLNAFTDFMKDMSYTKFVFYTYSTSLVDMIKVKDIQNAIVMPHKQLVPVI
jgi:hypothetical protein